MAGEYTNHHAAKDRLNGAIKAGNIDVVTSMINDGISAVDPDDYGMRPLFYACQHGSVPIVSLLAQHKADLNAPVDRDAGRRPLYYAAEYGHADLVSYLIKQRADINATDKHGQSALLTCTRHLATQALNVPNKAIWVTQQDRNPDAYVRIAEMLIYQGANVNLSFKPAYPPAHYIRETGIPRLMSLLEGRAKPVQKRGFWAAMFGHR